MLFSKLLRTLILPNKLLRPYLLLHFLKQCGYSSLNKWTIMTRRSFLICGYCCGSVRQSLWLGHWHSRLFILFRKQSPYYSILIVNVKGYIAKTFSLYLQFKVINILLMKRNFGIMKYKTYPKKQINIKIKL